MAGIDLPSGIKTLNPVPVEFWSGPYTGTNETAAKLAANTTIPLGVRFPTMEVSLIINGIGAKYWYKDGVTDGDLIEFVSQGMTLNTNQTVIGEKTFQNETLLLGGVNGNGPHTVSVLADNGAGTVLVPETGLGITQTLAYQSWVNTQITSALPSQTGNNGKWLQTNGTVASWQTLDTSVVSENTNLYFTNARAIAAPLTGYVSGAGTISATDSILQAIQKLNGNISGLVTGVSSFNTRTGPITLTSTDVTDALTFTPYNATNPNNYIPLTALSSSATGLTYTNTTGVFSLTSGYVIPTTTQETDWNTSYTNRITSLTNTGDNGAATLISNVLNIPTYTLAGLGGVPTTRTLTIGQGASAVDLSANRTFLDNVPNVDATNGTNISSGTVADARLSSNVALKNIDNLFTANQTISKTTPILNLTDANNRSLVATKNETNNNYTLTNTVSEVGGALSNSMNFTSTTGYIEATTAITSLSEWSVSFWVFKGATNGNVLYMSDGTNALNVGFQSGGSVVRIKYNNVTTTGATATTTSGWAHYVVMKTSGGALICYQNNTLLANSGSGVVTNISSINKIRVGNCTGEVGASAESGALVNQRLDQLVLYNKILSAGEVSTIWASSTGTNSLPATANILLRYEFNEGTGLTTQDASGNSYTGTLFNTAQWGIANGKITTEATFQNTFLQRSRDGIYTGNRGENYFGDPFGGTWISGRSVKFTRLGETVASLIHDENGNTLISPNNTTLTATAASPLTVVGNTYLGANVAATARLHIAAGSASAGSAPIKLTSSAGAVMSTPEAGAVEFDGTNYFVTSSTTRFTLAKTLTTTAELDFPSTGSNATSDLTITLTGAADGDVVMLGTPNASATVGTYFAFVSAANTITVRFHNTSGGSTDPTFGTFRVSIIKY